MIVDLEEALRSLQKGEIVAIPTETVYGLAAPITNEESLKKVFETKKRPFFDPLIVHVENKAQAQGLTKEWPEIYDLLAASFWPGPLTLIAPKNEKVSALITSGLDTVALRAPNHPIAQKILKQLSIPLAAPSANRFGKTSPTTAAHVELEFDKKIPVVDGGPCDVGVESTVLRAEVKTGLWNLEILRPGGVSRAQIEALLHHHKVMFHFVEAKQKEASPGHLEHHYQPDSPLILASKNQTVVSILQRLREKNLMANQIVELRLPAEAALAARVLYSEFRRLSKPKTAMFFKIEPKHQLPEWEAVMDRLKRASSIYE